MMHTIECGPHDVKIDNGSTISYRAVYLDYRCRECGGTIVCRNDGVRDWIECGRCHGQEFIHTSEIRKQEVQAAEIMSGLPAELQRAVTKARSVITPEEAQKLKDVLF